MPTYARALAAVVLGSNLMSGSALATDHLQETLKLVMKRSASGAEKFVWVSKMPGPVLPTIDPRTGGAAFQLRNPISGLTNEFAMPDAGVHWMTNSANTVLKFVNHQAPGGDSEVKLAVIRSGNLIKVVGKKLGSALNGPSQGAMATILRFEESGVEERYCGGCASPLVDESNTLVAINCPAPAACGSSPSTAFVDGTLR